MNYWHFRCFEVGGLALRAPVLARAVPEFVELLLQFLHERFVVRKSRFVTLFAKRFGRTVVAGRRCDGVVEQNEFIMQKFTA